MKSKPKCVTVLPWLQENLGKRCLVPLTNTDSLALAAAVQITELFAYSQEPQLAKAFGLVVEQMQQHMRELAYHAIAHSMDWSDRSRFWAAAGLQPIPVHKCAYE